jgi:hypothetical protein
VSVSTGSTPALKLSRSAAATPNSSPITRIGRGATKCSIKSTAPRTAPLSMPSSSSSAAICSIPARSYSTVRAVQALLANCRSLVWSGGSFSSMFTFSDDACEPSVPGGKSAMARAWSLLSLGSLSSALASA